MFLKNRWTIGRFENLVKLKNVLGLSMCFIRRKSLKNWNILFIFGTYDTEDLKILSLVSLWNLDVEHVHTNPQPPASQVRYIPLFPKFIYIFSGFAIRTRYEVKNQQIAHVYIPTYSIFIRFSFFLYLHMSTQVRGLGLAIVVPLRGFET